MHACLGSHAEACMHNKWAIPLILNLALLSSSYAFSILPLREIEIWKSWIEREISKGDWNEREIPKGNSTGEMKTYQI